MANPLPADTKAPDFSLRSTPDQFVSLSDFRGRPVILAFYPGGLESGLRRSAGALQRDAQRVPSRSAPSSLGISVDGVWCHIAFAQDRKLHFPLLADFEPKGEVAREYGVYRAADGTTERALFVIDARRASFDGVTCSPVGVNPGADGILHALGRRSRRRVSHDESTMTQRCSRCPSRARSRAGACRRAGDAGRVRRLRVPALRPRAIRS